MGDATFLYLYLRYNYIVLIKKLIRRSKGMDTMIKCPNCGFEIADVSAGFCPNCGFNLKVARDTQEAPHSDQQAGQQKMDQQFTQTAVPPVQSVTYPNQGQQSPNVPQDTHHYGFSYVKLYRIVLIIVAVLPTVASFLSMGLFRGSDGTPGFVMLLLAAIVVGVLIYYFGMFSIKRFENLAIVAKNSTEMVNLKRQERAGR